MTSGSASKIDIHKQSLSRFHAPNRSAGRGGHVGRRVDFPTAGSNDHDINGNDRLLPNDGDKARFAAAPISSGPDRISANERHGSGSPLTRGPGGGGGGAPEPEEAVGEAEASLLRYAEDKEANESMKPGIVIQTKMVV